jgi:hypothetical protein
MSVVTFAAARPVRSQSNKLTRYRPILARDGSILISAEDSRRHDAEMLTERLSKDFIGKIQLMDDDQLVLLEILAEGVFTFDQDKIDRFTKAATALRFRKRRTEQKGGA